MLTNIHQVTPCPSSFSLLKIVFVYTFSIQVFFVFAVGFNLEQVQISIVKFVQWISELGYLGMILLGVANIIGNIKYLYRIFIFRSTKYLSGLWCCLSIILLVCVLEWIFGQVKVGKVANCNAKHFNHYYVAIVKK